MNAHDEPSIEDRLRHTLQTVAATTVVPDVADVAGSAVPPVAAITPLAPAPRSAVLAWRLIGAAAVVALVIATVTLFGRGGSEIVNQPGGPGTSTTSIGGAGTPGTTTMSLPGEVLDATGVPIRPSASLNDHWHAAYGLYVCDHFLPDLIDVKDDALGIHTHGEGVIHIHPFTAEASGKNATLERFADQVGLQLAPNGMRLPNGDAWPAGMSCNGSTDTTFGVFRWSVDDPSASVEVFLGDDATNVWLSKDRMAYTIAVLHTGVNPPKPPSVPELDKQSDVPCSAEGVAATNAEPGTVCVSPTTSTVPAEGSASPTTTAAPTTVTAPPLPTEYCTGYNRWKEWMIAAPGAQSTLTPEFRSSMDRLIELAPDASLAGDLAQLRDLWSDPNAKANDGSTAIAQRIDEASTTTCALRPE
jgi:hypothetical protein